MTHKTGTAPATFLLEYLSQAHTVTCHIYVTATVLPLYLGFSDLNVELLQQCDNFRFNFIPFLFCDLSWGLQQE